MGKHWFPNFKRKSKNCVPVLKNLKKNLKPNVPPRPSLKSLDLNWPVNLKKCLSDSMKPTGSPPARSKSTSVVKQNLSNFSATLKNIISVTSQPYPAYAKSTPRPPQKCLNKLIIFSVLSKSSRRKSL